MRRMLTAAALAALMLNLGGCVLALDSEGDSHSSSWSSGESDTSLARAVRARLDGDPLTEPAEFTVTTEHGRVYLDGITDKPEALAKAVQIALDTPDVKSVRCHVTVIR
ncbi:MAG TPA: BON domain-containing protein [Gammaproteobacteria bacterium]|nr:BON domain-containing protein [Gammaproteobacteria bacterium]